MRSSRIVSIGVVSACLFCVSFLRSGTVDDFGGGEWRRFDSTPGSMLAAQGKLTLVDSPEPPAWVTVSKTFRVDVDRTPIFLVSVAELSDRGTVKLIRKDPYDKRVALDIDRPGLYAVDMRKRFGWEGSLDIETCLYAIGDESDITYEYVAYAEALTPEQETQIAEREAAGNVTLNIAAFEVVPLFNACSYYFRTEGPEGLSVSYREAGGVWREALAPVWVPEDNMIRGSIANLSEGTEYELQVTDGEGGVQAHTAFTTWRTDVPIAKTIVLDAGSFDGHMTIRDRGAPDGWIRVTAAPGFVLRNDRSGPLLELDKAQYVLLDGLTLRGGLREAVSVKKCRFVRIVNCDIAGWGRIGTQRFDLDGKYYTEGGQAINWDSAILVSRSLGTVVERCYIHDPVSRANSWYYSHPAGPQAVGMDKPRSTVIRYNDFIGSDEHRWNDAIEGAGNFHIDGGFNRDADIYGNFMCFANDDALEIDGGQTNVRVFRNKFEGCLCGVSIQGCMSGPSYVFQNLLVNMGDERGRGGQTIKTSSYANGPSAVSFIFNNTCAGESSDLRLVNNLRIVAQNNIFAGRAAISGRSRSPQSTCDYNLLASGEADAEPHGIAASPGFIAPELGLFSLREDSPAIGRGVTIPSFSPSIEGRVDLGAIPFGSDVALPERPIPVRLDRGQLRFSVAGDAPSPAQIVTARVTGNSFSSRFSIAKNTVFDWLDVQPSSGVLSSGNTVTFTVTVAPGRMRERTLYRGAFLVRLESGFSRPVTVYATTDVVPPARPSADGVWVQYLEAEAPSGGRAYAASEDAGASGGRFLVLAGPEKQNSAEFRFTVPQKGTYFLLLRVRSEVPVSTHDSVFFALDGGELDRATLSSGTAWTWSMLAHNRRQGLTCLQSFALDAGDHVLSLAPREPVSVDLIAITDNPGIFE